jgi:hypothetical protein
MPIVRIFNPQLREQEPTILTSQANSGATTLNVKNTQGFGANDFVLIGNFGDEKSEITQVSNVAPTPTTITLASGTIFAHTTATPVYRLKYNKIKVFRAPSESGPFSLIATIDIEADDIFTTYDDLNGSDTDFYKFSFFNSFNNDESAQSSAVKGSGYDFNTLFSIIGRARELFVDPLERQISFQEFQNWVNEAYQEIAQEIIDNEVDYYTKKKEFSTQENQDMYALPEDFKELRRAEINYTSSAEGGFSKAFPVTRTFPSYSTDVQIPFSEQYPRYRIIRDSNNNLAIQFMPKPRSSNGVIRLYYSFVPLPLQTAGEKPLLPLGADRLLVSYALYRAWTKAAKLDRATTYYQDYLRGKQKLIEQLQKVQSDLPNFVDITDTTHIDLESSNRWLY